MFYQVGGQNWFKGFLANNWLDLLITGFSILVRNTICYLLLFYILYMLCVHTYICMFKVDICMYVLSICTDH